MERGPQTAYRRPRQRRSAETLERILTATEGLLLQRSFARITVNDIVQAAKTSTGSFYARFADKNGLLPALYERYAATITGHFDGLVEQLESSPASLTSTIRVVVQSIIRFFQDRQHLLRALALYVRRSPDAPLRSSPSEAIKSGDVLANAILAHRSEIRHPDPSRAAEVGLFFVVTVCREQILFGHTTHATAVGLSESEFLLEATRLLGGYLQFQEQSAQQAPNP